MRKLILFIVLLSRNLAADSQDSTLIVLSDIPRVDIAATGDLDNDGDIDIITAPYMTIYINEGNLEFTKLLQFNFFVESLEISDLNGDELVDLIIRSSYDGVEYMLNLGAMNFENPLSIGDYSTIFLKSIDLNGDDMNDVITMYNNLYTTELLIYYGESEGLYDTPVTTDIFTSTLDFEDIDLDGDIDIIGLYNSGIGPPVTYWVKYFLNDGIGNFVNSGIETIIEDPNGIYWSPQFSNVNVLNIDQDSFPEIVISGQGVIVLETQLGIASYEIASYQNGIDVGEDYSMLSDFNGNGTTDHLTKQILLQGNVKKGTSISIIEGILSSEISSINYTIQENSGFKYDITSKVLLSVDLNEDGFLELIIGGDGLGLISSFGNDANSELQWIDSPKHLRQQGWNQATYQISDYNNDGLDDILSFGERNLMVGYLNQGDGTYLYQVVLENDTSEHNTYGFVAIDLNNDSLEDICVIRSNYTEVSCESYINLGLSEFELVSVLNFSSSYLSSFTNFGLDISKVDFNGDGFLDISILMNSMGMGRLLTLTNNTSNGFFVTNSIQMESSGYISQQQWYDINSDTYLDLLVELYFSNSSFLTLWVSNLGIISEANTLQTNISGNYFSASDFNEDGLIDFLQGSTIYLNSGDENFEIINLGFNFYEVYVSCDVNGDGHHDIIGANFTLIGNGNAQFMYCNTTPEFFDVAGLNRKWLNCNFDDKVDMLTNDSHGNFLVVENNYIPCTDALLNNFQIECFYDQNENGNKDEDEIAFPFALFDINPGPSYYSFNGNLNIIIQNGTYEINAIYNQQLWICTTSSSQLLEIEMLDSLPQILQFGFIPNGIIHNVESSLWVNSADCFHNVGMSYQMVNTGNTNGYVDLQIQLDSTLELLSSSIPPDSIFGNQLIWTQINLNIGEYENIELQLASLDTIILGDVVMNYSFIDYFSEGSFVFSSTIQQTDTITCSYDPNDITEHNGHTYQGYILSGDELDYTIRFQNTGNAPAQDVRIENQLSEKLDWSTMQPIAWSHDFQLMIDETGRAIFSFDEINLPDSVNNEAESHGFVRYRIMSDADLIAGEIIENTAEIFFDFNPAIITNTEINTIYDCADLEQINATTTEVCTGETITLSNDAIWAEELTWTFEGNEVGSGTYTLTANESGTMTMNAANALCSYEESFEITTLVATASFSQNGNALTANTATSYQWYLNGNEIANATSQTIAITVTGNYSVMIIDGNGCGAVSEEAMVEYTGVGELSESDFTISPNPAGDFLIIDFHGKPANEITICDISGRVVLKMKNTFMRCVIDVSMLNAGNYFVQTDHSARLQISVVR